MCGELSDVTQEVSAEIYGWPFYNAYIRGSVQLNFKFFSDLTSLADYPESLGHYFWKGIKDLNSIN